MGNKYKKWIHMPDEYQLVVGDTFELFYKGIILCGDPSRYNIKIICKKGAYFKRKYMFTPTENDIGVHDLTLELSDDYGQVLDEATVKLVVNPPAKSPDDDLYILTVGDSLSAYAQWAAECQRRVISSEGEPFGIGLDKVHFIGSRFYNGVYYEGYGGWAFSSYNSANMGTSYFKYVYAKHDKTDVDRHSQYMLGEILWKLEEIEEDRIKLVRVNNFDKPVPDEGVLTHVSGGEHNSDIVYTKTENASGNPFWNIDENRVDFIRYAKHIGAPRIDMCVILLGWNSSTVPENNYKQQVRTFINNLRADFPNCRIVISGLQVPSQNGFGVNYGTSWNYLEKVQYVFNLDRIYKEIAAEYENISSFNLSGQFDTDYGYPTIDRKVNMRVDKIETIQSNGVHPAHDGYMQIADAMFREINGIILREYNS